MADGHEKGDIGQVASLLICARDFYRRFPAAVLAADVGLDSALCLIADCKTAVGGDFEEAFAVLAEAYPVIVR
jgi:hypothetical protein